MYFMKQFNVLAVDDEPDMLAVIKMALRNVKVFGLPINLETASSKAEAIAILDRYAEAGATQELLSVVFLDVVMETNSAGLEVAEYIRNTQKNYVTQIYVVTGQPGVAPEREVIDRYNISGYLSKPEADETKLYSLVKSGIREANTVSNTLGMLATIGYVMMGAGSRSAMHNIMDQLSHAIVLDPKANPGDLGVAAHWMNGKFFGGIPTEAGATELMEQLCQEPAQPLEGTTGSYVVKGNALMVQTTGGPNSFPVTTVLRGTMPPTPFLVRQQYQYSVMLGTLFFISGD